MTLKERALESAAQVVSRKRASNRERAFTRDIAAALLHFHAEKLRDAAEDLSKTEVERLREALVDMVNQFAYPTRGPKISTGGLSALEDAFEVLGWEDPHPTPERKCDEPGCDEHSTCGWPSPGGYRRTCFEHGKDEIWGASSLGGAEKGK